MITFTINDIRDLPPISDEEIECIKNFKNTDFSDCPMQTPEELKQFRPFSEVHPKQYAKLVKLLRETNAKGNAARTFPNTVPQPVEHGNIEKVPDSALALA